MAKESHSERTEKSSPLNLHPTEIAAIGKQRFEEFLDAQTELLNKLQQTNREWLERLQSERQQASEFAAKLTAARSVPEAMTACQEWTGRRFEMMAEDGKHLLADTQKFVDTGARLLSNGWLSKGSGVGK